MIVLVHSPLLGPFSWSAVASELRAAGVETAVPALELDTPTGTPHWRHHAASVAATIARLPEDQPLVLAGHSGAGVLLPPIRQLLCRPVAGYLFIDAGIPQDGRSRLGPRDSSPFERSVRPILEAGGRFPEWTDAMLEALVPEAEQRQRLLAELHPQRLVFWDEPLPLFQGWPDAPVGYLHFSAAYDEDAERARELGWPVRSLPAGHFHILVDPAAVAAELLELIRQLGVQAGPST